MRVYRVENEHGLGPFHYDEPSETAERLHERAWRLDLPGPPREGLPVAGRVCGAHSKKLVRRWFGRLGPELEKEGYKLYQMDVPKKHVNKGSMQVTFPREAVKSAVPVGWP